MSTETIRERVHTDIRDRNWTILTEDELGFAGIKDEIEGKCYSALEPVSDVAGPVRDRYRAKDFCVYRWVKGDMVYQPVLEFVADDSLMWLGEPPNQRTAQRVPFCTTFSDFVKAQLALMPPERRLDAGTWGVHTFRSFTNVVAGPHQDGFEYGGVMVVAMQGEGANSYLYTLDQRQRLLDHQLKPGEIFLFKDSEFLHGATELFGTKCYRDALVIQFNAPEDVAAAKAGGLL